MRRNVRQRISPFGAGLIAVIAIVVGCYFGFTKANPFADRFELSAAFKTANDLKKGSAVRIAGVNIGKVVEVTPIDPQSSLGAKGGGAIVRMELEDAGLPLHEDATAKVRPRIFLEGNWFVELTAGSPSAPPMKEGGMIPVQNTSAPVQFGQILTALQSDTRQDLQVVLDEYGRALHELGGAKGYNRSIPYWKSAFRDSAIVNEAMLGEQEHDLSGYIAGADKFARGLDRDPEALKALVTNLAITADAFASEDVNLRAAIKELPKTLTTGQSALAELNDAFPPLRRFVAELRPAVRSSGPALDAQLPLIKQLRGLVSKSELRGVITDLRAIVPDLTELNVGGVDLQKELRLLSSCSNEVLIPHRNDTVPDTVFKASGPVYQEQVKWMPGIAAESRNFDANGQYVRSLVNGFEYAYPLPDGRIFTTGLPLQGVNPPKAPRIPELKPDVPCETQVKPDLRSTPDAPPAGKRVNFDHPNVKAAWAKELPKALDFAKSELERMGIKTPISGKELSLGDLPALKRTFKAAR